jgi:hypothetical protein
VRTLLPAFEEFSNSVEVRGFRLFTDPGDRGRETVSAERNEAYFREVRPDSLDDAVGSLLVGKGLKTDRELVDSAIGDEFEEFVPALRF